MPRRKRPVNRGSFEDSVLPVVASRPGRVGRDRSSRVRRSRRSLTLRAGAGPYHRQHADPSQRRPRSRCHVRRRDPSSRSSARHRGCRMPPTSTGRRGRHADRAAGRARGHAEHFARGHFPAPTAGRVISKGDAFRSPFSLDCNGHARARTEISTLLFFAGSPTVRTAVSGRNHLRQSATTIATCCRCGVPCHGSPRSPDAGPAQTQAHETRRWSAVRPRTQHTAVIREHAGREDPQFRRSSRLPEGARRLPRTKAGLPPAHAARVGGPGTPVSRQGGPKRYCAASSYTSTSSDDGHSSAGANHVGLN